MRLRLWLGVLLSIALVASVATADTPPAPSTALPRSELSPSTGELGVSVPGLNPITLIAVSTPDAYREPLPDWATGQRIQGVTFSINYLPAGSTNDLGDYCLAWPSGAQAAFGYAATVWAVALNSTVPIRINACWANLGYGVLGHSATTTLHRDFSGSVPGTWYAAALANAIAGTDLNGSSSEMEIAYSGNGIDWYFGTDGHPGSTQYDFVSVVLHEITHGLGFAGTMRVSALAGGWGGWPSLPPYYPAIYDRFTENGAGTKLIDTAAFPNGSFALGNELTGNNIYFDGSNAVSANGGSRPKLYAPATWKQGSSYSHLDEIFNGTTNALMTYSLDDGEAVHNPGPVTLGILKDVGWTQTVVPVISSLDPSLVVRGGVAFTLKVNGGNFASGSTVRWNGSDRTTTYVSASLPPT